MHSFYAANVQEISEHDRKKHRRKQREHRKIEEKSDKSVEKYRRRKEERDKSVEKYRQRKEERDKSSQNEKVKKEMHIMKAEQLREDNRQMEVFSDLKEYKRKNDYKLQISTRHRPKVVRERPESPDNTLREIKSDMPNLELKHVQSSEIIYTDDQLM